MINEKSVNLVIRDVNMSQLVLDEVLDIPTIKQYIDVIGPQTFLQSVTVFEEIVPQYLEALNQFLNDSDALSLCQQAHQLKGAAGSIGLKRLQLLAHDLQQNEHPEWTQLHAQWVQRLIKWGTHDILILKAYIREYHA
jgi:two-component system, OmpR family, aerobic respiration control sensor histidine kinase ArcB